MRSLVARFARLRPRTEASLVHFPIQAPLRTTSSLVPLVEFLMEHKEAVGAAVLAASGGSAGFLHQRSLAKKEFLRQRSLAKKARDHQKVNTRTARCFLSISEQSKTLCLV
jgi:hypothetical protein